jgi:hypothetical protein
MGESQREEDQGKPTTTETATSEERLHTEDKSSEQRDAEWDESRSRQAATDSVGERFQMGGDATLGGVEGQPTGGGDQVTTPAEDEEAHPYSEDEVSEPESQQERGEPGSRDKGGPPGSGPVERPAEPVHDATEYSGVGPQDRMDKEKMPPMPPGDQGG